MRKVKLIVHEKYAGKQSPSDVFAAVFLSDTAALMQVESLDRLSKDDEQFSESVKSISKSGNRFGLSLFF